MMLESATKGAGIADVPTDRLAQIASRILNDPHAAPGRVEVAAVDVQPIPYVIGTPSTCSLLRWSGEARVDGAVRTWAAFVKVLQSPRAWSMIDLLPAPMREAMIASFPWRLEIDAQQSTVRSVLPDGLRMPDLYDVVEIDDLHAAVWMEYVETCAEPWSADTFTRAAFLLGQLAGRRPRGSTATFGDPPFNVESGVGLRLYTESRVLHSAGTALCDDSVWSAPVLAESLEAAGETSLRADLQSALRSVPRWLDVAESLPATYVHGDASPQNLLVPAAAPDTFVVIDWGFNCPQAIGFDLGQLLIGLVHAGELRVVELPRIHEAIVPAYCAGLATTGFEASPAEVELGYVTSLVIRAAFTALPFERLGEPDTRELRRTFAERIALSRYLLDLADTQSLR